MKGLLETVFKVGILVFVLRAVGWLLLAALVIWLLSLLVTQEGVI